MWRTGKKRLHFVCSGNWVAQFGLRYLGNFIGLPGDGSDGGAERVLDAVPHPPRGRFITAIFPMPRDAAPVRAFGQIGAFLLEHLDTHLQPVIGGFTAERPQIGGGLHPGWNGL